MPDGSVHEAAGLDELCAGRASGGYAWVDVESPTREVLEPIAEALGIHALSVEDCLDQDQVPKIDEFADNTFVLVNAFRYSEGVLSLEEVNFALGSDFLMSVHPAAPDGRPYFAGADDVGRLAAADAARGPDFLMHRLLDGVVDAKFTAIESIQEEIDSVEEQVIKGEDAFRPDRLLNMRHSLLILRKSLVHEREVLLRISRRDSPRVSEAALYHFRDVYDHLARFFEATEICRDMIASLVEIHLSVVSVRMSEVANRTNQTMRRLTLITTIFMPLTLLAGVGGMSEWSMMTGPQNWRTSYPAFMLGMVALGFANYWFLRWLESRRL